MAEEWKGKKVLVTGANGFVGSWVTEALVNSGADVTALIRDSIPNSNLNKSGTIKKISVVTGSLTDLKVLERAFNEYEIDTVFHLAAQAIVGVANRSPISTFESNIMGTWNILEACRTSKKFEKAIIASSDKAYGDQENLPYTEEAPLLGTYPYDASKACTEIIARSYQETYGLRIGIARCANIYGGGDMNPSRLVPDMMTSLIQGRPLVIRSDGKMERDYIYVKDAVSAYLTLAKGINNNELSGQSFNFGTGKPITVLELVKKIIEAGGKKNAEIKVLGEAKYEIRRQYLNSEKALKMLGWKPKYSLEQGLKETFDWYESNA
ncbi:GDP-mannose 4,6-dehydratase [Candidatus Woesearchaeota archaeon]|nr:GDP-mannose 4,6-dehydratase [Candidatus Woesearchaeota archaeon]